MKNSNIQYSINRTTLLQIIEHLTACDSGFIPALSTQVKLDQYSQKILENATRFEAFSNNQLVGLMACYFNDYKKQIGFITNVSVMSAFNGKGIAKNLLSRLLEFAAKNNFYAINLEVNKLNLPALSLYKSFGFTLTNEKHSVLEMTIQISNNNK